MPAPPAYVFAANSSTGRTEPIPTSSRGAAFPHRADPMVDMWGEGKEKDTAGRAWCDETKPPEAPYDIDVSGTEECARKCVRKHEEQHRDDRIDCCRKYRKAFQDRQRAGQSTVDVVLRWLKYMEDGSAATECKAYGVSEGCLIRETFEHGCSPCPKDAIGPKRALCDCIDRWLYKSSEERRKECDKDAEMPKCPF